MDKFLSKTMRKLCISNVRFNKSIKSREFSSEKLMEKSDLNSVVKEAEKIVGCSPHSLSIQRILNNELVETYKQKIDDDRNTYITKAEKVAFFKNSQPMWGLVVLLVSKMAASSKCDCSINESQRVMAEIAEMLKIGALMHKNIVNIGDKERHLRRNNLSLLLGDYLLSKCLKDGASLRNSEVLEIVISAIRDVCESQFLGLRDKEGRAVPSKPLPPSHDTNVPYDEFDLKLFQIEPFLGDMKAEWMVHNIAGSGSSLGKCIRSALLLANHEFYVQKIGYQFGRNIALAWQASLDRDSLKEGKFDLISAPVMFHLEYDPGFYKEIQKGLFGGVDYNFVRKTVMSGPGLDRTFQLEEELRKKSLRMLEYFPACDARTALGNLIQSS